MRHTVFFMLSVAAGLAAGCAPSELAEFECQEQMVDGVVLHYALADDETSVRVALQASTTGYAAVGVGTGMRTSDIVVGYVSADGVPTVTALSNVESRTDAGVQAAVVQGGAAWMRDANVTEFNGTTTTAFTYVRAAGFKLPNLADARFVWAVSPVDGLARHSTKGKHTVVLSGTAPAVPPTDIPAAVAPRGEAPECVASQLSLSRGTGTYDCMSTIANGVALHWTLRDDRRLLALESRAQGYVSVGFPTTPGTMGPGTALVALGTTAKKYAVGGSKAPSAFQESASVLGDIDNVAVTTANGAKAMHWEQAVGAAESQVFSFNVATHSSSNALVQHDMRASVVVDLGSGGVTAQSGGSNTKVKAHAVVQVLVWAYLVPVAVLVKAAGPFVTQAKVSTYPVPFVVHAVVMFVGIVLTIAMVGLALDQFESETRNGHKGVGIVVMVGAVLQLVMQVAKPDTDSPYRTYFRLVHIGVGVGTLVLAWVQLLTGAKNYEDLHNYDKQFGTDMRIASIVGMCSFTAGYAAVTVYRVVMRREETNKCDKCATEPAGDLAEAGAEA